MSLGPLFAFVVVPLVMHRRRFGCVVVVVVVRLHLRPPRHWCSSLDPAVVVVCPLVVGVGVVL